MDSRPVESGEPLTRQARSYLRDALRRLPPDRFVPLADLLQQWRLQDSRDLVPGVEVATDLAPFGKHRFRIPFNAAGKKWVRFAVWDSAGNGALVQPIKLAAPTTTSANP